MGVATGSALARKQNDPFSPQNRTAPKSLSLVLDLFNFGVYIGGKIGVIDTLGEMASDIHVSVNRNEMCSLISATNAVSKAFRTHQWLRA